MPELPEVETICLGLRPHLLQQTIKTAIVRQPQLRWRVQHDLAEQLAGLTILSVERRAKYLLLNTENGCLILHLGMSGRLRILPLDEPVTKHDHVDFVLSNDTVLRFNDTRRFGAVLWTTAPVFEHSLLNHLGLEPLAAQCDADYLFKHAQKRKQRVKTFLMDGRIMVGVGNIYANEALFMARILPHRLACHLSWQECQRLMECVRQVLQAAIQQGGTTLKDFVNSNGEAGYFQQQLHVYGRAEQPCTHCGTLLSASRINNRSTVFCTQCQT